MTIHRRQFICFASGALGLWGLSACRQGLSTSAPAPATVATPRPSPAPAGFAGVPQGEARIIVISDLNSQFVRDLELIARASEPDEWSNTVEYIPFR